MDTTEEIKSRLDIADLIAEYLPLKPAGAGAFKTVCPFHQEKTPSFFVSRTRQSWHCFGCDIGGDHFSFVERMEGMEFREALEFLAQKTGVQLPVFQEEKTSKRKRIHEINEMAARFFSSALRNLPQAEPARAYVRNRGLDDLSIDLFRIGYAPALWSGLSDALMKKGVTAGELLEAGLAGQRDHGGVYDRFRDRIMFPIMDVHGNIAGFTGRILSDEKKEAKYLNTPETSVYRKSALLYGLDKAKGEIRQQDLAVIVEGNMDVVSSHQYGVHHVVASSGTALTAEQLGLIHRFTSNLAIAFDADAAGKAATLRGLDLARSQDFSIRVISFPPGSGKDPDEVVRKDPAIWKQAIKDATGIMEWIYRQAFRAHPSETADGKKTIARDVLPEIRRIVDPVERDHWLRKLAHDLSVSDEALRESLRRLPPLESSLQSAAASPLASNRTGAPAVAPDDPASRLERRILVALLAGEQAFFCAKDELGLISEEFNSPDRAALYAALILEYNTAQSTQVTRPFAAGAVRRPLSLTEEQAMLFRTLAVEAERAFEQGGIKDAMQDVRQGVQSLRSARRAREGKRLEDAMREAERQGDAGRIAEIVRRFAELSSV